MYRRPAACHRSLHRQSPGIPGHTDECCERITLPLLVLRASPKRPRKLDPCSCSRRLPHHSRPCVPRRCLQPIEGSSFAMSPRTTLKSTVSPIGAIGLSHSFPLSRAQALRPSSRLMNRLSTYDACRTSHGDTMLLLSTFSLRSRLLFLTGASTWDFSPPWSFRLAWPELRRQVPGWRVSCPP